MDFHPHMEVTLADCSSHPQHLDTGILHKVSFQYA